MPIFSSGLMTGREPKAVIDATAAELAGLAASAPDDAARLADLFERGTPRNTRIAYERDLAYIAAWKRLAFCEALDWPERREVAIRFVLDHSEDLAARAKGDPHRATMEALAAAGLRRSIAPPAPPTLDRIISSWRAMHRLRGLDSPFDDPLVKAQRTKARKAVATGGRRRRSANAITLDVLEALLEALPEDAAGFRDRALFLFAWTSGGRRPSEVAGLRREMLDLARFETDRIIDIRLHGTKTTGADETPALLIRSAAADAMERWLRLGRIAAGPVFRRIDQAHRISSEGLTTHGINHILKKRLEEAGYPRDYASAHGFRSGFLTDCARLGIPLGEAMRLSLHKSPAQAMAYYQEAELERNKATMILG